MATKKTKLVVRVFTFFDMEPDGLKRLIPNNFELSGLGIEVIANQSGECDLAIVIGFARPGFFVICSPNRIVKVVNEPWVEGLFHRFVRRHSSKYGVVLTPHYQWDEDPRVLIVAGNLDWHLSSGWDELKDLEVPKKTELISAVVSAKNDLPGHSKRLAMLDRIQAEVIELTRFGRGTGKQIKTKEEGLLSFRYSLAFENSIQPNYLTEKLYDCWLAWTVPVYFGAPNVLDFFPAKSLIRLDPDDLEKNLAILRNAITDPMDFEKRVHAVAQARRRVLTEFSLQGRIIQMFEGIPSSHKPMKIRLSTFDSFLHATRDQASRLMHYLTRRSSW